ncbi:MAG: cyclomaltodextrinase [Anaerolineales bacterium]|nr:cyclomaltodextrinase [Anaerolineales bacterium]
MSWANNAVFYHIYPLGLCGAPPQNDLHAPTVTRLEKIHSWLDHLQWLGVTAVILGPVFEARSHGYDTVDYLQVDRRLGTGETLGGLVTGMQARGIRVVLDAVFNHVSRDFFAFRNVCEHLEQSEYWHWFAGIKMGPGSLMGDPFVYEGWNGHLELVKLNTANPDVREYLLGIAGEWIERYGVDGFRLDAADCLDTGFQQQLAGFCRGRRKNFWLLGEIVFGDYTQWANERMLDSVTNYEIYKGLYSSLNDHNLFEIAHSLQRQYDPDGIYRDLNLYNFVDNHDVDRIASRLENTALLPLVYGLLFTIPGIPSIYYGSEWGWPGEKLTESDRLLRPDLDLDTCIREAPHPMLPDWLRRLAGARRSSAALQTGRYSSLLIQSEQLVFSRSTGRELMVVALNTSNREAAVAFTCEKQAGHLVNLLAEKESWPVAAGKMELVLPPYAFKLLNWQAGS